MAWAPDYVTAQLLADYMNITHADDDTELAGAASAASRAVDYHCNRQFGSVTAEERFYQAWYDYDRCRYVADIDDVMSVVGLVVEIDGTAVTDFVLEPRNAAALSRPWERLTFGRHASLPWPTGEREVGVTTPWGWTTVPTQVPAAVKLQGSRFHSRRNSPFGIAGSPEQGSELRLLSKLDADVAIALKGLVRARRVG